MLTEEDIEVSRVLACLNEPETFEAGIAKARGGLRACAAPGEVISDNRSNDSPTEIARAAGTRMSIAEERGYGSVIVGPSFAPFA